MKTKKLVAFMAALLAVSAVRSYADAWDPTKKVTLPLYRMNYPGDTQATSTIAFARSDNPTQFKDVTKNDSDPVPPTVLPSVSYSSGTATANISGILSEASSTADARCNTSPGVTTSAGSVNVSGTSVSTAFQTLTSCNGTAFGSSTADAEADFRIDQHATYDTKGEKGWNVTLVGKFDLLVSTTITGNAQLTYRDIEVYLGTSSLVATSYLAAGWNITGSLTQSTAPNPGAAPVSVNTNAANGMDLLYPFTEAVDIGDVINLSATAHIGTQAVSSTPTTRSANSTYSVLAYFSVDDYKTP